jgi:hypothetical protein
MQQRIFNFKYNILCEAAIIDVQYPNMGVDGVLTYSSQCDVCEHVLHGHILHDKFPLSNLIITFKLADMEETMKHSSRLYVQA